MVSEMTSPSMLVRARIKKVYYWHQQDEQYWPADAVHRYRLAADVHYYCYSYFPVAGAHYPAAVAYTHLYIGKKNKQNDYVTFTLARGKDLWFHTKNIPGSHVILKTTLPQATHRTDKSH